MSRKLMIAIVSALMLGTASAAMAQFDPNLANRYPAYADPIAAAPHATMHSRPAALHKHRSASHQSQFSVDQHDHASSPYADF